MSSHFDAEHWLWLLGSLAQLHSIPFDPLLLKAEFPPPLDKTALLRAGQKLGLVISPSTVDSVAAENLPTPVVAWLRSQRHGVVSLPSDIPPDEVHSAEEISFPIPALIVRIDANRVLYFEAGSDAPHTIPTSEFAQLFEPEVLLVKRALEATPDPDMPAVAREFNFRWFLPEFLKHKQIWRDVLIVSAILQILGLTTPLLTQVIIDKVVVHQTMSTLTVVGVGLAIALLFSAGFGWLRQYLVIHTGNRIDAVLGSSVFRHLLRLPLPYFQHRPTGTLVARLHGVETIRESFPVRPSLFCSTCLSCFPR